MSEQRVWHFLSQSRFGSYVALCGASSGNMSFNATDSWRRVTCLKCRQSKPSRKPTPVPSDAQGGGK